MRIVTGFAQVRLPRSRRCAAGASPRTAPSAAPRGVAARIASRSSANPMSSISSASSSTTIFTAREVERAAADVVQRAARRGDDDVDAALERADLPVHRRAAVDRHRDDAERLPVPVDRLGHLHRQLARRHEHQRRGALARRQHRARRDAASAARTRRSFPFPWRPAPARRDPSSSGGMAARWIGVGSSYPSAVSAARSRSSRPRVGNPAVDCEFSVRGVM